MTRRDRDPLEEVSFSDELEALLDDDSLTVGDVMTALDERSFALVLMLVMFPSALPVPTGGVTHVLEIVAALVSAQLVVGRTELWLPKRMLDHQLGPTFTGKFLPAVMRRVRQVERIARPRFARLFENRVALACVGAVILLFVVGAFVAPPFSGLDTLPSIGVVVVSLGLVFRDGVIVAVGVVVGLVGIGLVVALASALYSFL
jgi:hypothetical protein